jgi:hypothetical protein
MNYEKFKKPNTGNTCTPKWSTHQWTEKPTEVRRNIFFHFSGLEDQTAVTMKKT